MNKWFTSGNRRGRLKKSKLRAIRQEYQNKRRSMGSATPISEICSRLDISEGALLGYERGERLPNVLLCSDMCRLFGTTVIDLYPK